MKKQMLLLLSAALLLGTLSAHADKRSSKVKKEDIETMTILDKGVKRTLPIDKPEGKAAAKSLSAKSNKENKKGLLIRFSKNANVDIKDFGKKYDLKLKNKMKIGYYIFENRSKESDVTLMARIIENESGIDSVKPNWKKKNRPR